MNHKSQSIILRVLGAGFVLSLFLDLAVPKFTGLKGTFILIVPISLGLLVSLLASYVVYTGERELTTTFAVVVFVLATLAAFILMIFWYIPQ